MSSSFVNESVEEIDGKKIKARLSTVKVDGRRYSVRIFEPDDLVKAGPNTAIPALAYHNSDMIQLVFAGMYALAKDLYARHPRGTPEFANFAAALGLKLIDADGEPFDVAAALFSQIELAKSTAKA